MFLFEGDSFAHVESRESGQVNQVRERALSWGCHCCVMCSMLASFDWVGAPF